MTILSFISSCFGVKSFKSDDLPPTQSPPRVKDCVFCDVSRENGFAIVYEDEEFVVFKDRRPAALHHLLVIPRRHIGSVKALSKEDLPLVQDMERMGHARLDDLKVPVDSRRLGFHIPPFNSINHLHLHVLGLPFRNWYIGGKYPLRDGSNGRTKGWTWFVEVSQVRRILGEGGAVKVKSC
ncbi:HIT-like protein [Gloeopeniophorella convolvens]|nr:HIT-like protein [Gloeopeniophorella convolvens]